MLGVAFHIVAAVAACVLIWILMDAARATGRFAGRVVAVGFLVRAFMAQALFWFSYLRLPIARSMQLGGGYWFFGFDGTLYVPLSDHLIHSGWKPFVFVDKTLPSPVYMQLLGIFIALFGASAFVAVLINLFCYLGTSLIVCRWGRSGPDLSRPALIGLVALTFSPSGLLWSSQPLKDTLIAFMTVLFIGSGVAWELWQRRDALALNFKPFIAFGAMALGIYVLAGIRWYFAVIAWASSLVFFILSAATLPRRRILAFAANMLVFAVLSQMVVLAAGPYLPPALSRVMRFQRAGSAAASLPGELHRFANATRRGFDATPAATMIAVGRRFQAPSPPTIGEATYRGPHGAPVVLPTTTAGRLMSGYVAMIVPHAFAESLGLVHMGGGRGLWLFADFDTLVFDAMLFFAIYTLVVWVRLRMVTAPTLWQIVIMAGMISAAIAYAVNNFGTLFRHRDMVYVAICLIPVAGSRIWQLARESENAEPAAAAVLSS